jgi:hypothetical protein
MLLILYITNYFLFAGKNVRHVQNILLYNSQIFYNSRRKCGTVVLKFRKMFFLYIKHRSKKHKESISTENIPNKQIFSNRLEKLLFRNKPFGF